MLGLLFALVFHGLALRVRISNAFCIHEIVDAVLLSAIVD